MFDAMIKKTQEVVFEAKKLMKHSRRRNLTPKDIENALNFYYLGQNGTEEDQREEFTSGKAHRDNPINSKIKIEWVNLSDPKRVKADGCPEGVHSEACYENGPVKLDTEKRFLYDWFKDRNNMEGIKPEESKDMIIPFPNVDDANDISLTILKFIKLRIKSESYHLLQIMGMALRLSNQIIDYCEKVPSPDGTLGEPRRKKIREICEICQEIGKKLQMFMDKEKSNSNMLIDMLEDTNKCIERGRAICTEYNYDYEYESPSLLV
mmetsp:Transcript_22511/g.22315  ORF Transcript_22511/g.22315 Transcript_22511/m.22315 type:complete len:264 (+) Transcript_22511:83-874(+)